MMSHFCCLLTRSPVPFSSPSRTISFVCLSTGEYQFLSVCACCCIGNNYLLDTQIQNVCVCCRVSFPLLLLQYPFWFCFSCFSLLLLRYSKMQFYSCQGNLTPSAKMQALLAITSAPSSPSPSPLLLSLLVSRCACPRCCCCCCCLLFSYVALLFG